MAQAPAVVAQGASDARAYRDALLARGLSLEETKPLLFARLVADLAPPGDSRTGDEYWRSSYATTAALVLGKRLEREDRVRSALLDLYGPSARRDAAFAPLFAPLDDRYAFLASQHQLALQKLQVERLLAQAKRPATAPPAARDVSPVRPSGTGDALADLRARLGAGVALEYAYRFSPLAEEMRSANVELSAAEFHRAFQALLAFESAKDAPTFARTRAELRGLLGDARFTRLWAARDPYFATLAATGREYGVADSAVLAAYAVVNDAQDRFAAAAERFVAADSGTAGTEVREIQRDVQQRLVALLGEEAAVAMSRAIARLAVSLQQPSSTNLRE